MTTVLPEEDEGVLDPLADSEVVKALMEKSGVVDGEVSTDPADAVEMEEAPDPHVELLWGLHTDDIDTDEATVRELTGRDEEHLGKDSSTSNWARFISELLGCGVETIGGEPATKKRLDQLLIGDRDLLIMKVRQVTYGDTLEMHVRCPHCSHEFDILYSFEADVPVRKLEGGVVQKVDLRNGRWAEVRLPNGEDQQQVFKAAKKNVAEQNTLMLDRVIVSVMGEPLLSSRDLPSGDRAKILQWVSETMPGPRYDEVSMPCEECEGIIPVVIDLIDLFRG